MQIRNKEAFEEELFANLSAVFHNIDLSCKEGYHFGEITVIVKKNGVIVRNEDNGRERTVLFNNERSKEVAMMRITAHIMDMMND